MSRSAPFISFTRASARALALRLTLLYLVVLLGPLPVVADSRSDGAPATAGRITILYDAFGAEPALHKDWGFAALIEVSGKRILFDTGNDPATFAHNVTQLGIDLGALDFVVLSHRHGDHVGGLAHLLERNPAVPIYAPQENFGVFGATFPGTFYRRNETLPDHMRYFDGDPPEQLEFGTAWPGANFRLVKESREIAPGFHLIRLKGSWGVDLELIELSLAIETPAGIVLVVGCSHPTIERIVEAAVTGLGQPLHLVVGGLHLLPAADTETRRIASALRDTWKVERLAPDHCTGEPAFDILQRTFGDRYVPAGLGARIEITP